METDAFQLHNPIRFVTATSLYDGHDVSINIMRRMLQDSGAEVVHLGHNRSARGDRHRGHPRRRAGDRRQLLPGRTHGVLQVHHDLLRERGPGHIKIFGGGGGVILPDGDRGAARLRHLPDLFARGRSQAGAAGDDQRQAEACDFPTPRHLETDLAPCARSPRRVARLITLAELALTKESPASKMLSGGSARSAVKVPVLGITGTGGAGKSSLTDELVRRFLRDFPDKQLAILSVDPTRQRTGGALLGDRIRMNAIDSPRVYMRSLATRQSTSSSQRPSARPSTCSGPPPST